MENRLSYDRFIFNYSLLYNEYATPQYIFLRQIVWYSLLLEMNNLIESLIPSPTNNSLGYWGSLGKTFLIVSKLMPIYNTINILHIFY